MRKLIANAFLVMVVMFVMLFVLDDMDVSIIDRGMLGTEMWGNIW